MGIGKTFILLLTGLIVITQGTRPTHADSTEQYWQGFYAGLALGGAYSAAEPKIEAVHNGYFVTNLGSGFRDDDQLNPILQRDLDGLDVSGSVLVGYDIQSGNITFGLEGDLTLMDFSETKRSGPTSYNTAPAGNFTTETTLESDFALSLRPKIGYVMGDLQFYVSAGPSVSRFKTTHHFHDTLGGGKSLRFTDTKTALGLSSGIGAGYRIDESWVLRGDYVFSFYPDILDGSSELNGDGDSDFSYDSDFQSHNIRVALIRRF